MSINTHIGGILLDDRQMDPFYKAVSDLDIPILVHPASKISLPHPHGMEQYDLTRNFGRAFDTTINIARLILSGTLDRFASLRFVFSHLGGAFFALKNRFKSARVDRGADDLPSKYQERIFVDTAPPFWSPKEIRFAVEMMGEGQVLLGSDFPRFPLLDDAVMIIRRGISNAQVKKKLLGENAGKLFC